MPSDRLVTGRDGLKEIEFQPSTIETIDFAMFNYLDKHCNLHTDSNKGWKKVPVIWVGAERAFQVKERKEMRDSGGMLMLPMMSVERISINKDPARRGMMPADLVNYGDPQGGAITIARRIKQDKTSLFRGAAQKRRYSGDRFGGDAQLPDSRFATHKSKGDGQVVYETITMPMPSYVVVEYKLKIQTDFHIQMNQILQSLYSRTGNHKYFKIEHDNHRFEAFMEDFSYDNNLATLEEDDRTLKTEVSITVEAYLIGGGKNAVRPKVAIRENAVSIALPSEGVVVDNVVLPERFVKFSSGAAVRAAARLMQEVRSLTGAPAAAEGQSGGSGDLSSVIAHTDFKVQQSLTGNINGSNTSFTLPDNPRSGTVTLILNGLIMQEGDGNDFTLDGSTVTMAVAPDDNDRLVASYISQ